MFQGRIILGAVLLSSLEALAQVAPSAYRNRTSLTVGGYYSNFDAGYLSTSIAGTGAYADLSPSVLRGLGVEGEARWLVFNAPHDFSEYNYLVGPRYKFLFHRRFEPYAKLLLGAGEINFPYQLGHGGYFALAPGAGVDVILARRVRLRADYEYQIWPSAVGVPGIQSGALKPNGFSVGMSYRIF